MKYLTSIILTSLTTSALVATDGTYTENRSSLWSDPTRWVNDTVADGAGATATIDRSNWTGNHGLVENDGRTIGSIIITGVSNAARTAEVRGSGTITLNNSGNASVIRNDGWGLAGINSALFLENDLHLIHNAADASDQAFSGVFAMRGNITASAGATSKTIKTLAGNVTSSDPFTHRYAISSAISGNIALWHNSGSYLNLQGSAKTFTGGLTIQSGAVRTADGLGAKHLGTGAIRFISQDNINDRVGVLEFTTTITDTNNAIVTNDLVLEDHGRVSVTLSASGVTTINWAGEISGAGNLYKEGNGSLILNQQNSYTGDTIINNGQLGISAHNAIDSISQLILQGGSFNANGYNQSFSMLHLYADGIIDLGNDGTNTITIGDSSSADWNNYVLHIVGNFTDSLSIRFGTDQNGLSSSQLDSILINGNQAYIDSGGYLTTVPEPSAFIFGLAAFAFAGYACIRRRKR